MPASSGSCVRVNILQSDCYRHRPDLARETDEEALIRLLRVLGLEERLDDEEHASGSGDW